MIVFMKIAVLTIKKMLYSIKMCKITTKKVERVVLLFYLFVPFSSKRFIIANMAVSDAYFVDI